MKISRDQVNGWGTEVSLLSTLTMTPKERLSPVDRKALLCSILKFLLPGNWRIMMSTHIIEAISCQFSCLSLSGHSRVLWNMDRIVPPNVHAVSVLAWFFPGKGKADLRAAAQVLVNLPIPLTAVMIQPRVSLSSFMMSLQVLFGMT